jgi:hypothetical protein
MREEAGRLKQTLSGFKGTVSTFHMLGVLTRIETARLGNTSADFGNLADDVSLLAGSIEARVQRSGYRGPTDSTTRKRNAEHFSARRRAGERLAVGDLRGLSQPLIAP